MRPTALKHAMYFGLMLGLAFCLIFFLSTCDNVLCNVVVWVAVLLVPYAAYRLTVDCRERVCDGYISYSEAFLYGIQLFFYAAIVGAAFKLVYFKYIAPDFLPNTLDESLRLMEQLNMPLGDAEVKELKRMMTPLNMSLNYIWIDMVAGTLVSLVVAAVARKNKPNDAPITQNQ